jgi:FkbM family methyltransferase
MQIRRGRPRIVDRILGNDRGFPMPDLKVFAKQARVALTPRNRLLKTRLSNGAILYGKNRAGFGGRAVYIYGDATEPEFEQFERFLDATGVFIEVGANTGKWSIKAAKHYADSGVVVAIEPFPDVMATLYRSVQANGFSNVRLRNVSVSDHTGTGTLWMNNSRPQMFSLVKSDDGASPFSTLTVSLDDLFRWEGLDRLDYLKIDAEGAEEQVLAGGYKTIEKYRPIIHLEATRSDASVDLDEYTLFRAPRSAGKFYMPNEHNKIDVPPQLGWPTIAKRGRRQDDQTEPRRAPALPEVKRSAGRDSTWTVGEFVEHVDLDT